MKYIRQQVRILEESDDWLKKRAQNNERSKNGELNTILKEVKRQEEKEGVGDEK